LRLSVLSQHKGLVLRRLFVLVFAAAGALFLHEFSSAAGSVRSLVCRPEPFLTCTNRVRLPLVCPELIVCCDFRSASVLAHEAFAQTLPLHWFAVTIVSIFPFGLVVWIVAATRLGMILESPNQKTREFLV
jgi:hypothetical protein